MKPAKKSESEIELEPFDQLNRANDLIGKAFNTIEKQFDNPGDTVCQWLTNLPAREFEAHFDLKDLVEEYEALRNAILSRVEGR